MDFEIDNLTIALLFGIAALLLYQRFFKPSPLVHSLLLGGQSAASQVRQPGESPLYRSWATGHGTPVRPGGQVKTVDAAAKVPPPALPPGKQPPPLKQRFILDTPLTNEALAEIVRLVPLGLRSLFPLLASSEATPILTLLPPSPSTSLPLLLLALASEPRHPLAILPNPRLLAGALAASAHPSPGLIVIHASAFDSGVAGLTLEDLANVSGVLIVGDPERKLASAAKNAAASGAVVRWWEEIWDAAEADMTAGATKTETQWSDTFGWFYTPDGEALKATHLNMTAGMAGFMSLFPADKRPTSRDVVGSTIPLDTPFGMSIALAAVWSGAGLRLLGPEKAAWDVKPDPNVELGLLAADDQQPLPSVLVITPPYHAALVAHAAHALRSHPFGNVVAAHKLNDLRSGYVGREGWIDGLVRTARKEVLGGLVDNLRAVIVVGDTSYAAASRSHVVLSLPLTRLTSSPYSAGPIFVSHMYDLQSPVVPDVFAPAVGGPKAHSGPPASNVEVVLRGVPEPLPDEGPTPGHVWVRGPAILEKAGTEEGWVDTGLDAAVAPNGTFTIA